MPTGPKMFDINSVREFYKRRNLEENSFHFTKVSEKTISNFLKELKTNKGTGIIFWNYSNFLKNGSKVLATPIAQICSLSIKLSAVPDECKIAKLKSLYKKGKNTDPKNYKPITLLPVISKILEKVIQIKLCTSYLKTIFRTNFNQVFKSFTPEIFASRIYKIR